MSHFQFIIRLLKMVMIYEIVFSLVALWTKQYEISCGFLALTLVTVLTIRSHKLLKSITKVFSTTPGQVLWKWHTAITTKEEDNHGTETRIK